MQSEEEEILSWCKEKFGEYYEKLDKEVSYLTGVPTYTYERREWRVSQMGEMDMNYFWRSRYTGRIVTLYPFDRLHIIDTISKEENFFLRGMYRGEWVNILVINTTDSIIYQYSLKILWNFELESLAEFLRYSSMHLEKFKKITSEDVEQELVRRKMRDDKVKQDWMRDGEEREQKLKRMKFTSVFFISLGVFLIILIAIAAMGR